VNDELRSHIRDTREKVGVDVSHEQHELKKENTGRPYGCGSAEVGKEHFANHRLAHKKQECT
jgi:hypothetical protein